MNNKASARDVVLIGALIFALGIGMFAAHNVINRAIDDMVTNPVINSSTDTVNALQNTQELTNKMDYIVFGVFMALCLAIIVTGYFIGGYPIFMFLYFIFIVIGVVLSAIFANTWETITQHSTFLGTLAHFALTNHLILYLPIYTSVVGFLGVVAMFAKPFMGDGL